MHLNFDLTNVQSDFLQYDGLLGVYRGGLGAGKTLILVLWALTRMAQGRYVLMSEPTFAMVQDVLATTFIEVLDKYDIPYQYNKSRQIIDALGGRVYMRSAEAFQRWRGINADDFAMDEASYQSFDAYEVGIARAGRRLNDGLEQYRLGGTPLGRDWVYKLTLDEGGKVFTQSTFKNPFLSDSYKRNMLKQYTSEFARQELYGEIVDFSAGVIRSKWFKDIDQFPVLYRSCRSWDLAFTTKKASDFSAGSLLTLDSDCVYLHDMQRHKKEWPSMRRVIIETAQRDGIGVPIVIEAVSGQIALVNDLQASPELRNHTIIPFHPKGDKMNRAMGWSARAEQGKFFVLPDGKKDYFYEECDQFTADDTHEHDDCVDCVSQGVNYLLSNSVAVTGNIKGV